MVSLWSLVVTFSGIVPRGYLSTVTESEDLFPVTSGDSDHPGSVLGSAIYHSMNFPLAISFRGRVRSLCRGGIGTRADFRILGNFELERVNFYVQPIFDFVRS